jgi:RNA polymerase-binding protein DksA
MPNKKKEVKKYDQYKKALLEIKEQVVGDLKVMKDESTNSNGNGAGDVSGHALHMADVATDMYDREFNLGLASNDRETLSRVNDALQRISEGEYGNCIQCEKPIAVARLKAIPYVETCVKCQEQLETKRR